MKASETSINDNAGVAFQPPFLVLACLLIGFGLREVWRFQFLPANIAIIVGPGVVGTVLIFFFWSIYTMQTNGGSVPTGTPTPAIVCKGPYRVTRNPIYLAMFIVMMCFVLC